jgi:hypothetical protein
MVTTLNALLSRDIPNIIAENLVAKKQTLASLNRKSDTELIDFGLLPKHIEAIRDTKRLAIPSGILRQVMEESWRICCVCHRSGRPIVVHHILEWSQGGTHAENNLAVLCLDDHDNAHLTGGLSLRLTANAIRDSKKKWIARARKIRDVYEQKITSAHHRGVRWYWIHVWNLRAKIATLPNISVTLGEEFIKELREKKFIGSNGNINPDSMWIEELAKPKKSYLFDSSDAQSMAIYVSDLLGRFIANSAVLDITDMLTEKAVLLSYLSVGSLVYFRHQLEIQNGVSMVKATINKTDVRIEFAFDPWTSLNQTAHGIHVVADMAERSVVGEVSSIGSFGQQLRISVSPLGISPDFVLHDPAQGDWVKGVNNADHRTRRKRATD